MGGDENEDEQANEAGTALPACREGESGKRRISGSLERALRQEKKRLVCLPRRSAYRRHRLAVVEKALSLAKADARSGQLAQLLEKLGIDDFGQ